MPRCLVVQHVAPEEPYAVAAALRAAGVEVAVCRLDAGDPLPADLDGIDGLVVMGGPMSATGDTGFPTRRSELALLADAADRGMPVLGVCLGAQLLAAATGGEVTAGTNGSEIGWGPVDLTAEAAEDPLLAGLPARLQVLHWHGDTFAVPPGAVHLASSPRYRSQAFRIGDRAWGFQFHVEVDRAAVAAFVDAFGDDAGVIDGADGALAALAPFRERIATRFAGLVSRASTADGGR
ncbi:MAG TPA: type 1 glutamine amidotransferase, partial [Acidimicrobiales bacterium]|nr:type 1 glutamine amidotransferase [Acidimicrobiales bacterium]